MPHHAGSSSRFSNEKEYTPCPRYIIAPVWQQFEALLSDREIIHPLDCRHFRMSIAILISGCAYERITDGSCYESTLRCKRDE